MNLWLRGVFWKKMEYTGERMEGTVLLGRD